MPSNMEPSKNFEDVLRRGPGRLRGEVPTPVVENPLRILFVTSAHNSLSQRAYIALTEMGHDVTVQVVDSPEIIEASVEAHKPDLVVCPMLKQFIPESVCVQVHLPRRAPGTPRGPWGEFTRLGDRARHGRVGRDRARGRRGGRRRRHLGDPQVPHAPGRQEQHLPPRGAPRRGRDAGVRGPQLRAGRLRAASAELRRPVGDRPAASADQAGRSRDRLALRLDRRDRAQDPRRRGSSGRARHDRRRRVLPVQRLSRARPPRPSG